MFHLRNVPFLEQRPVAVWDANTEFRLKVWHKVLVRVSAARDTPGTPGPEEVEPEWASSCHRLSCLVTPSLWWRLMLTEWSWPGTEQGSRAPGTGLDTSELQDSSSVTSQVFSALLLAASQEAAVPAHKDIPVLWEWGGRFLKQTHP